MFRRLFFILRLGARGSSREDEETIRKEIPGPRQKAAREFYGNSPEFTAGEYRGISAVGTSLNRVQQRRQEEHQQQWFDTEMLFGH